MHELSLTHNLIDTVVSEAQKADATKVSKVYLTIGYARDIVDDLLFGCYEYFSKGTIAEGSELVITRVPLMVRCDSCGFIYQLDIHDEASWKCPACGSKDYTLYSGREFCISRIEVV